jgi:hypothetical protein
MAGGLLTRREPHGRRSGYGKGNLTEGAGKGNAAPAPALPILGASQ